MLCGNFTTTNYTYIHWRRKWQSTPVFLPEGFQGQKSLANYRAWGHKESDTNEQLMLH